MDMFIIKLAMALSCCWLGIVASCHAAENEERNIYAHYMGCYFIGLGAISYHYRNQGKDNDIKKTDNTLSQIGGGIANWPLVPLEWNYTSPDAHQAAELEIRRAMRMGLSGFVIDAWAGGDGARKCVGLFLDVCKEKSLDFTVTICMDPSCHAVKTDRYDDSAGGRMGAILDTTRWLLSNYGDHPKLARRDGKPLIFTYSTQSIQTKESMGFGNGKDEPARWREKLRTLQAIRDMAHKEFKADLYVHFDMDGAFRGIDMGNLKGATLPQDPGPNAGKLAEYLCTGEKGLQGYDAIGGFLGESWNKNYEDVAAHTIKTGKEWAIPMWHQYNNKFGSLHVGPGTDIMRQNWEMARKTNSTLIQYVTWNDFGEDTTLCPTTGARYTVFDLVAHQIKWWKTGKEPKYDHDKLYLIYRRFPITAVPYPYNMRRWQPGVLEVSTILTKPGTIRLPGRDASYEAPAGLYVKQFPLTSGPVSAEVVRNNKVVMGVTSPDPITDKPMREDNSMVCYSSEFERQWEMDFPGIPPEVYAENGDEDNDGLPNWFEMLWFGEMGNYKTATVADPDADPDGDGKTNLQEYQARTNPLETTQDYQQGFAWNMATVHNSGLSLLFDPDSTGRRVWQYFYRFGDTPVPLDGDYLVIPSAAGRNVPYAGEMSHHTPAQDPRWNSVYGWISRKKKADDKGWDIQLRTSSNSVVMLGWKSPVTGRVSLKLTTAQQEGRRGRPTLTVQRTNPLKILESLEVPESESVSIEIPSISVKSGDRLYIIGSSGQIMIGDLEIKLLDFEASK